MRRTGNRDFQQTVVSVMNNTNQFPSIVVRHAVVEGVKSGLYTDITKMKNLAAATQDPELYSSTVYALGLLKTSEAVKAITSVYGRYSNADVGNASLKNNETTILNMLNSDQTNDILAGITATQLIKLHPAVEKLQLIEVNSKNEIIRNKAHDAIVEIEATPKSNFPSNSYKWEDR